MVHGKQGSYLGKAEGFLDEEMPPLRVPCHEGVKKMKKGKHGLAAGRKNNLRMGKNQP